MNEIYFSSLEELYQRVLPALRSKKRELHYYNYKYITEIDIWNYLKENKWQNKEDLTLHELVDDILHTDNDLIDEYTRKLIIRHHRNQNT